ncbi:MAG TPA: hypothetical protein PKC72_06855 [Chitinophagaceae bacterium]|nr:hypothetical protein [Chitinophagaceae bacterium]
MSRKKFNRSFATKRRKFLKFLGLSGAVAVGHSAASQIRVKQPAREIVGVKNPPKYISVELLRPYDLLSLELRFYNFSLSGNSLQKKGSPAHMAVVFQPQSISEQGWVEEQNSIETPTVPGKILIGAESRLVFEIPSSITSIPLDVNELLAWEKYELVVNERAKQPPKRIIAKPVINSKINAARTKISNTRVNKNITLNKGLSKDERLTINNLIVADNNNSRREVITNIRPNIVALVKDPVGPLEELETSLEVPLRLYLSPTKLAGWSHLSKITPDPGMLKATNKLFELWHTRMGTKTTKGIDESDLTIEQRIVRALWADDADKNYKAVVTEKMLDNVLGLTSMTNKDRHQIVHESSNFQIPRFVPAPIKAYKLFLTTLGAWLDSEMIVERKKLEAAGVLFGDGNALNLLKWRHIETLGREHYVEIVKAGNIMPFGHEAVLIKITERKPHARTGTAANFQRKIVVVTEPVKDYNYRDSSGEFMNFSFSRVEIVTTVSPLLDVVRKKIASSLPSAALKPIDPKPGEAVPPSDDLQFVIISGGKEVPFKIKGEDLDGNIVDFTLPLAFVSTDILGSAANVKALSDGYNKEFGGPITTTTDFNGQKFTLAPQATNATDTSYVTKSVSFKTKTYTNADEPQGFLPTIGQAEIFEPSYQRLTGIAQSVPVTLVDDNNQGHVFAAFKLPNPINFSGQTDKTGGMAAPNFNLSGLSKAAGAFGGDIEKFKTAAAAADDFFKVSNLPDPKLFGVFKLSDILNFLAGDKSSYDLAKPLTDRVPKIPNLVTEETKEEIITSYVIKPQLKNIDLGFAAFVQKGGSEFSILTQVKVKKKNPTAAPEFSTEAWLKAFKITIMKDLINIDFNEIRFNTKAGKKADVSVEMANPPVAFGGPLEFINNFNSLIPSNGFSDPPYLDVTLTGIKCGFTMALPNVQMGVLSLSNMTLGAEVNLPFTGAPLTFGFRFCERQQPFTLTVSFLGGGGFFGLEIDLNGIRQIEASLEFGAAASINLGVASGGVSIMAGIYFKMTVEDGQNSTSLTGYVRINGSLCILGLITASLELYLALTYLIDKKKAFGEATLKLKIEILFFSASVTLHAERTFAGSGSDPNFQMAIKENEWLEYCGAFAA